MGDKEKVKFSFNWSHVLLIVVLDLIECGCIVVMDSEEQKLNCLNTEHDINHVLDR